MIVVASPRYWRVIYHDHRASPAASLRTCRGELGAELIGLGSAEFGVPGKGFAPVITSLADVANGLAGLA
jgi:hypothetical protein